MPSGLLCGNPRTKGLQSYFRIWKEKSVSRALIAPSPTKSFSRDNGSGFDLALRICLAIGPLELFACNAVKASPSAGMCRLGIGRSAAHAQASVTTNPVARFARGHAAITMPPSKHTFDSGRFKRIFREFAQSME